MGRGDVVNHALIMAHDLVRCDPLQVLWADLPMSLSVTVRFRLGYDLLPAFSAFVDLLSASSEQSAGRPCPLREPLALIAYLQQLASTLSANG